MVNEEVFRTRRKDGKARLELVHKAALAGQKRKYNRHHRRKPGYHRAKKSRTGPTESETRYKAIFESAREGIIVGIIETRQFMYANPAICKMFGYTAEELTRLTVNDIHRKEDLPYVSEQFEALMRGEEAFTQNIPCLRKNGTIFYADISATRIIIDNKACFVGFFTDTTERKHTEDSLRENPKPKILIRAGFYFR